MPSSKGSSQPRDGNCVSYIADGFFTTEALAKLLDFHMSKQFNNSTAKKYLLKPQRYWVSSLTFTCLNNSTAKKYLLSTNYFSRYSGATDDIVLVHKELMIVW